MVAWDVLERFVAGLQLDRHSSDRGASANIGTAKLRKLIAGSSISRCLLSHF
jgi:hypothetical protein